MGREQRHDILFEPVRIGPKTLRNRFYQVPHCTGFGVEKPWTQAAFRGMKAEGGWAAVCTEYCSISPESDETPYVSARLWDDEDMRALRMMTDRGARARRAGRGRAVARRRLRRGPRVAAAAAGAVADQQRPGQRGRAKDDGAGRHPPSAGGVGRGRQAGTRRRVRHHLRVRVAHLPAHAVPVARVQPAHRRVRRHASRTVRGSGWRRSSWSRRRSATTSRSPCGSPPTRWSCPGVPIEDGLEFIRAADPMVDLWDVVIGSMWGPGGSTRGRRGSSTRATRWTWSGRAREATEKPIVVVGRFTDPDRMADLVRGGTVDLIGAARPSISDPFLPEKIEQGRYDEIRECIGCNACYSRSIWGRHLGCTQNATAGEEYRRGWHPERFDRAANADRAVLVVGAGPAGMECATVLGKRGMELVHLVDGGRRHRRLHALDHAHARPRDVGPRDRLPAGAARPAGQRLAGARHPAVGGRACSTTAPRSWSWRPVRTGPATASAASRGCRSPAPIPRCRTC